MKMDRKEQWIHTGYRVFADKGPSGLKVEALAKLVGKSKSSFYHHFADLTIFQEYLLSYHLERAKLIAEEEKQCKNVDPELLKLILKNKQDLLFNRQLRVHRQVPNFEACFLKSNEIVGGAILDIWTDMLGLENKSYLAAMVLQLSMENFYLQITPQNLTETWLRVYFNQLKTMVQEFKKLSS